MTKKKSTKKKPDMYEQMTNKIVAHIEEHNGQWITPWGDLSMPRNAITGARYNGVNIWSLMASTMFAHHENDCWATYNQWSQQGAQVKKGEQGTSVRFYGGHREDDNGDVFLLTKTYSVFNLDQVENGHEVNPPPPTTAVENHERAEAFIKATGAQIHHGYDRDADAAAYYSPSNDHIVLPLRRQFMDTLYGSATENYYSTLFHELIHWTKHSTRLDRNHDYAYEELIAELGALMLAATFNLSHHPHKDLNHAAYLKSWLKSMKGDPKYIYRASKRAQIAIDYLLGITQKQQAA